MFKRRTKKIWVSASDVGRAAYCPHYLELKNRGVKASRQAEASRARGNASHDELNRIVQDKCCYIASYLYGIDDERTDALRSFRDNTLMRHRPGKVLVNIYYSLSPILITISSRCPAADRCLRYMVNGIVKRVLEGNKGD
ncbi:hypothetical protein MNBD_GAMMA05-179 [hydrothermal vent metagenome]|uniref:Uncharacterized protein n=1 Tax=hydrothermal vent metagenome TaxID=652676 RepID=A0A3B0X6H5_9ZZZZ